MVFISGLYPFLVKLILSSGLLLLLYLLLFRYKSSYNGARLFLLFIPFLSVLFAAFVVQVRVEEREIPTMVAVINQYMDVSTISSPSELPSVPSEASVEQITPTVVTNQADDFNFVDILLVVYLMGALAMAVTILYQVVCIRRLKRWAYKEVVDGVTIYRNAYVESPFSFGKNIFVDKIIEGDKLRVVIEHERAHILNAHYVDKFFVELFSVIMWFNPVVWMIRKELGAIHEFQSDDTVLQGGVPLLSYQQYLFEEIIENTPRVANGFNNSLIKKRFIMMKNGLEVRQKFLRAIGTALVVSGLFLMMSFTFEKSTMKLRSLFEEALPTTDNALSKFIMEALREDSSQTIASQQTQLPEYDMTKEIEGINYYEILLDDTLSKKAVSVASTSSENAPVAAGSTNIPTTSPTNSKKVYYHYLAENQIETSVLRRTNETSVFGVGLYDDFTRVVLAVPIHFDEHWFSLSSKTVLFDPKTNDRYLLRREEHAIPLDTVCVVKGHKDQVVLLSLLFPPLKKGVRSVDLIEISNPDLLLPDNGGDGWRFSNIRVNSAALRRNNTPRGEQIK